MLKYAKVINEETKACEVGLGTNSAFYQSIGMVEMEVEQAYNGNWYVLGFAPEKPEPTKEEQQKAREGAYIADVDPITCHINRLKDEEQTPEVVAEIAQLVEERKAKVEEIKQRYPYPVEESDKVIEDGLQREETEIEENKEKDIEIVEEKSTIL